MAKGNWPFLNGPSLEIERAEGIYLYSNRGRLMDAAGGAIVANVGHGRARVAEAVARATLETSYVVPTWLTPARQAMVDVLREHWLPPSLSRIHITSGGSESVEAAIKIAIQVQSARGFVERGKIITREISYHGTTFATTGLSGHRARKRGLERALAQNPTVATPYPLRDARAGEEPQSGAAYAEQLRKRIEAEGAESVAAFLAEPITGSSGGAIVPPEDYWPAVREVCDDTGVLLVMDEVMTGFGRTGRNFAHQHWPVQPDILVGGKGLAGGYAPLGAVFAGDAITEAIEGAGFNVMFHTFAAHPGACAAAAEVLSILVEEDLVARAEESGAYLRECLRNAFDDHPHVAEVRGRGLLQAIEIVRDRDSLECYAEAQAMSGKIVVEGLRRGVFFYGGGTGDVRDIVCMGPPFIISRAEIDELVGVLREAVDGATSTLR